MRFACSTSSFPEDRLDTAVAKAAWAGYDSVEIPLTEEPFPDEELLRTRLRSEDLELAAAFVGSLPAGVGEAEVEILGRIGRAAALARALDGPLVVAEAPREGEPGGLAQALHLLDRALGGLAVDVCLVNRTGTILATIDDLRRLWECGLPERVGLALDPAQAVLAGMEPGALDQLPELPRYVYLDDVMAAEGRVVPPGEGDLDWPLFGTALRREGYGGTVCLRLENADPWAVEPVAREARVAAAGWL